MVLNGEAITSRQGHFQESCHTGQHIAYTRVLQEFDHNSNPSKNLRYHNLLHTTTVTNNTETILRAIQKANPSLVSDRDICLGRLIASYHDIVQDWIIPNDQKKAQFRTRWRLTGKNEKASAALLLEYMDDINLKNEEVVFKEQDRATVQEAIMATVPGFSEGKVIQPNLKAGSSVIARALALADLSGPGMESSDRYFLDVLGLFVEDNIDFFNKEKEDLRHYAPLFKSTLVSWLYSQKSFVAGRKSLFEQDLGNLDDAAKNAVRGLFTHFDETAADLDKKIEFAKTANFDQLYAMF